MKVHYTHVFAAAFCLAFVALCDSSALGQPSEEPQAGPAPAQIPVAAPPPKGDYLPELGDAERSRAGFQMMMVVIAGLALVYLLLRLAARKRAEQALNELEPDPVADLVRRATEALENLDSEHDDEPDA